MTAFRTFFVTGIAEVTAFPQRREGAFSNVYPPMLQKPPLERRFRCWPGRTSDNDGYLDLFVAGYNSETPCSQQRDGTFTQVATNDFAAIQIWACMPSVRGRTMT